MVKKQEIEFDRSRHKNRERRAEKQLAEHEAKIPTIRTTPSFSNGAANGKTDAKRKREEQPSTDTTRGPKAAKVPETPSLQLGAPSRIDQAHDLPTKPKSATSAPAAHRGGQVVLPPRPLVQPSMVKKKRPKEDDIFMKKR